MQETRWGRFLLVGLVVIAAAAGAAGWYWLFPATRADRPAPPPSQVAPAPPSPAPEAPPAGSAAAPRAVERDTSEPITLSARELQGALTGHAPLTADEAFARLYQGREITWSGRVATVTKEKASLLRLDLVDDDGLRVVAWCDPAGREVTAGQRVTVRGRVATKLADGFVVERGELR